MRCWDGSNSNFVQLFKLCAEVDPSYIIYRLLGWFVHKTDKYVSGEIQNRILDYGQESSCPKGDICLASLKADIAPDTRGIRVFCPT